MNKIKRPRLNNANANHIHRCTEKYKKSTKTEVKAQPVNEEADEEKESN